MPLFYLILFFSCQIFANDLSDFKALICSDFGWNAKFEKNFQDYLELKSKYCVGGKAYSERCLFFPLNIFFVFEDGKAITVDDIPALKDFVSKFYLNYKEDENDFFDLEKASTLALDGRSNSKKSKIINFINQVENKLNCNNAIHSQILKIFNLNDNFSVDLIKEINALLCDINSCMFMYQGVYDFEWCQVGKKFSVANNNFIIYPYVNVLLAVLKILLILDPEKKVCTDSFSLKDELDVIRCVTRIHEFSEKLTEKERLDYLAFNKRSSYLQSNSVLKDFDFLDAVYSSLNFKFKTEAEVLANFIDNLRKKNN